MTPTAAPYDPQMPRQSKPSPRVVIFAGPNGAGKSTHADAILAALGIETFVNADYIARDLCGRSLSNFFKLYAPLADEWTLFDNSSSPSALTVAAHAAHKLTVSKTSTWLKLQKLSAVV